VEYPGADIGSDHNLLIDAQVQRKMDEQETRTYDIFFLSDTGKREILRYELDKYIKLDNNNNEYQWRIIKNSINKAVEEILEYRKRLAKKAWMTSEILT